MINISNTELTVLREKGLTFNKNDLINLTKMWKAVRGTAGQQPRHWLELIQTKKFIKVLCNNLNVGIPDILVKKLGRSGGSYGHWQLALSYAKYLDPEFHLFVNEVFVRYEIADPTLAADMAERMPADKRDWLSHRIAGIEVRKNFMKVLAEHGVKKSYLYGHCTDAMYKKILGNTARNLRKDLQLAPKTNIRNYLVKEDLVTVSFAEMVIKKNIEKKKLYYYKNCKKECEKSSEEVMNLLK